MPGCVPQRHVGDAGAGAGQGDQGGVSPRARSSAQGSGWQGKRHDKRRRLLFQVDGGGSGRWVGCWAMTGCCN